MNKIKFIFTTLIITLIFIIVAFFTYNLAESSAYDFMTKHFSVNSFGKNSSKKIHGNDNIVLVMIDNSSAERYRWPWKRELLADLFNYFAK